MHVPAARLLLSVSSLFGFWEIPHQLPKDHPVTGEYLVTSQMDPLSGLSSMAIWQLLPPCDLGKCEMFQGRLDLDVLNICLLQHFITVAKAVSQLTLNTLAFMPLVTPKNNKSVT